MALKRKTTQRVYKIKPLAVLRAFLKSSMKYEVGSHLELYEEAKDLENAVCNLPDNIKDAIEKFFGLITNNPELAMRKVVKMGIDEPVDQNLENLVGEGIYMLLDIEYLAKYDRRVKKAFNRIIQKAKKGGLFLSVTEAWKYVLLFLLFFETVEDGKTRWNQFLDSSINVKFLVEILPMFDIYDVAVMKSTVGLPLDEIEEKKEAYGLESMEEVENFRKKLFPEGDWNLVKAIFYGSDFDKEQVFSLLENCSDGSFQTITFQGISIQDWYELYSVYIMRKVW